MPSAVTPVVIVGGGISGLSAAWELTQAGRDVVLIERRPALGGTIDTFETHDCLLEGGPDAYLAAKPWLHDLIHELGLGDQLLGSNDHRRQTFVVRDGQLVPLPEGLVLMVPSRWEPILASPLLSPVGKEAMRRDVTFRPEDAPRDERSVAAFLRDHFGAEAVDYLAEPLLAGVYGGDCEQLSASSVLPRFVELERRYGSLTRGLEAERSDRVTGPLFETLRGGWKTLIEALARACGGRLTRRVATAHALERTPGGYRVQADGEWTHASRVMLATPAFEAGRLVANHDPVLAELLSSVPYSSSATVALGYDRASIEHPLNGFGFLVPLRERRHVLACTWVGTKWDHRVPDDKAVLRCFLGGIQAGHVVDESDETLTAWCREDLQRLMGVDAEPLFVRIHRWPRALAQYTVGHGARVAAIEAAVRERWPGLHLIGNAYHGIGLPDCVRLARQAAHAILS